MMLRVGTAAVGGFSNALLPGLNTLGNVGFAGAMHTGGVVGTDNPVSYRIVPNMAFSGAPRLHGGYLAPDEYPAILQRGESVLTRAQMGQLAPATPTRPRQAEETHHHYYIQAVDARSFADLVERNPGAIARTIGQSLRTGGPLRDAIRQHT